MLDRIEGRAAATETPIGFVPTPNSLTLDGLNVSRDTVEELVRVDSNDWAEEAVATAKFFEKFGERLPQEIRDEQESLQNRLHRTTVTAK
jgi:phosphoenolpyruvate carboxykinase (GTP)